MQEQRVEMGKGKFLDEKEIWGGGARAYGKWDMHLHIEKYWHEEPFPYPRAQCGSHNFFESLRYESTDKTSTVNWRTEHGKVEELENT